MIHFIFYSHYWLNIYKSKYLRKCRANKSTNAVTQTFVSRQSLKQNPNTIYDYTLVMLPHFGEGTSDYMYIYIFYVIELLMDGEQCLRTHRRHLLGPGIKTHDLPISSVTPFFYNKKLFMKEAETFNNKIVVVPITEPTSSHNNIQHFLCFIGSTLPDCTLSLLV